MLSLNLRLSGKGTSFTGVLFLLSNKHTYVNLTIQGGAMSLKIDDKYLPDVVVRKLVITEQINESKKIIFRNYLDHQEGTKRNQENMVAEAEFNVKQLSKKIDLLEEELAALE